MYTKTIVISVLVLLAIQHAFHDALQQTYFQPLPRTLPPNSRNRHWLRRHAPDGQWYRVHFIVYFDNEGKGRIYLFDMNNPKKDIQEMSLTSTKEFDKDRFQPHGISVWEDKKTGTLYLYAVNHERDGEERIEKFQVSVAKLSLQLLKSYYGDPTMKKMNDVVATGDDSFYFSNSQMSNSKAGRFLELLSLMAWSDVGVHDSRGYRIVADGIIVANGIQMSRDGKYVFVAGTMGQDLKIYERRNDNSLTLKQSFVFHTFPDNIMEDPVSGDLYIAFHPIGHLLFLHLSDPSVEVPSQILQITLKEGTVSSVTELFVDDGHLVSGSSVAIVYKKKMLIGSVINKLVYCDVNVPL